MHQTNILWRYLTTQKYYASTCYYNHLSNIDISNEEVDPTLKNLVSLSSSDKAIYSPWQYSIIVKVFGRKVGHLTLKHKLQELWKPSESLSLIDLGNEFFLIEYQNKDNMNKALHDRPWFVLNHFFSVRRWEPKFLASNTKLTYIAIWSRLPGITNGILRPNYFTKSG